MSKRPALGRGIDALFEDIRLTQQEESFDPSRVEQIDIGKIDPNKEQPRKAFDDDKLKQLADSIASVGILQPLVVAPKDGRFQIIAGERRWRAARLAKLTQVPCIVRQVEQMQRMEMALIENIQRADLNAVETAQAIAALITQCAITQEEAAKRLGKSRPAVANLLRLLTLSEPLQKMVTDGTLSEGHARALLGLDDDTARLALAKRIAEEGLSVRQIESIVKVAKEKKPAKKPAKKAKPLAELGLVEEAARKAIGVKVAAAGTAKKGKITLFYASAEELDRIYAFLAPGQGD